MAYNIKINNKTYEMKNKTIEVAKRIKEFTNIQQRLEREADGVEEIINEQYDFACEVLGQDNVDEILGRDLNEIDIDELLDLSFTILEGYESKALKKRRERDEQKISKLVNSKDINKLIDIAGKMSDTTNKL